MYNDIVLREETPVNCWAWKAKIPLKIKIFLWYLRNGVVLSKVNLVKRHWKRCTNCCFCAKKETIQHLFFDCPIAQLMCGSVCFTFGVKKRREWSIFLVLGLEVFRVSKGTLCWSIWRPYAGPCGSVGMIWYFKSHNISLFCRWSLGGHSGSGVGLSSLNKKGELFWRMVVMH
jgi:hypothetical protein